MLDIFRDRVSCTICLAWLWTMILLVSASWVAGITGVSHQNLAKVGFSNMRRGGLLSPKLNQIKARWNLNFHFLMNTSAILEHLFSCNVPVTPQTLRLLLLLTIQVSVCTLSTLSGFQLCNLRKHLLDRSVSFHYSISKTKADIFLSVSLGKAQKVEGSFSSKARVLVTPLFPTGTGWQLLQVTWSKYFPKTFSGNRCWHPSGGGILSLCRTFPVWCRVFSRHSCFDTVRSRAIEFLTQSFPMQR
jgi:hypothetical protein